jgi:death on curing protein
MKHEPIWVDKQALILLHAESLAEHGGLEGIRDEGLLDSALIRPRNMFVYEIANWAKVASAYGFGITRNHPFVDGNKRVAFLSVGMFLALNGFRLVSDQVDATRTIYMLASGELSESDFTDWISRNMVVRSGHCR